MGTKDIDCVYSSRAFKYIRDCTKSESIEPPSAESYRTSDVDRSEPTENAHGNILVMGII